MADIPTELQDSRVFKLHLRSNGLTRFPDSKLEGTGNETLYALLKYHQHFSKLCITLGYG